MNDRWIRDLIFFIDQFESEQLSVEVAHAKLHLILGLFEPNANPAAFDAIDLAESELEEIEYGRLLRDQRPEASKCLRELRDALIGDLGTVTSAR
jgi:hypothetical protein